MYIEQQRNLKQEQMKDKILLAARTRGRRAEILVDIVQRLKSGEEVDLVWCKHPQQFADRIKQIADIEVSYKPFYNGQGRKLGYMTKPENDEPAGYTFSLK